MSPGTENAGREVLDNQGEPTDTVAVSASKAAVRRILAINGGSASIKYSVFEVGRTPRRILWGKVERAGEKGPVLIAKGPVVGHDVSCPIPASDQAAMARFLIDWLSERLGPGFFEAVSHRIVHGGARYGGPERVTSGMISDLKRLSSFDPEHLPGEISLIQVLLERFPRLPQVACFDTAFHRDMPRVAQLLPIPRRYSVAGVRRYGFHGLSCAYLLRELARRGGEAAANGRVILAHLGSGASLTAVLRGRSMDTSMAFTPAAGLVMGSRCGDIDPGLVAFLAREEGMNASQFEDMVNFRSGLLGISEISADMRDLLAREATDIRASEAVEVFCYQTRKWIGAYAAALGGLDCLVFAGGIGENSAPVRERICRGLEFLGIELDTARNDAHGDVISVATGRVAVHVIPTDEELMLVEGACAVLGLVT